MSRKANPTSIGIFIVAGLTLGVAGLLLFSSSRLFTRSVKCIVYFDSSLNGLNEGAPVKYRGVEIGAVERVMIRFNQATNDTSMPVLIEIRDDLIRKRWIGPAMFSDLDNLDMEVERGVRASLETESLVTGILYVSLEVLRNPPPPVYHQVDPKYPEIPTRPTDIQQLMRNLARMDIGGLSEKLNLLIDRMDSVVGGLKLAEISDGMTNLISSLNRVATSPDLTNSLAELRSTLEQYRLLAENVNRHIEPLADSVTNSLARANEALVEIRSGMANLRDLLAPDSSLRNDLTIALEQLAGAAQSISAMAEYLQQHPNALITGRQSRRQNP